MGFFGLVSEAKLDEDRINAIVFTESDNELIRNALLESSEFDMLDEGANLEITKKFKEFLGSYKDHLKVAKKAIKSQDYSKAKAELKSAEKDLDGIEKELKNMDSDVGSAIFGVFASLLISAINSLLPITLIGTGCTISTISALHTVADVTKEFEKAMSASMNATGSIAGGIKGIAIGGIVSDVGFIALIVVSLLNLIKTIVGIKKSFDRGDTAENALNLYREKLLECVESLRKIIDKYEKKIGAK